MKRGEETLKKFIKAGLLSDTGESLEGRPIYSVSKKVNLNREPDNWAWFDGEETLISSNLVSNLALMIYAGQGQEPSILQKKEFVPFFERTKESDLYTFSFLDLKGVVAFQHSQALQEGVPAKELAKVKQMYAESQQRFVSFGIFKDGELKNEEEYYFDSEAYARDSMQGEEWHKAKMKAGEEILWHR